MFVGGNRGDQDIGFGFSIGKMADVAGMDHVKYAMAHDHFSVARGRSDQGAELGGGLQFELVLFKELRGHWPPP